MVTNDCFMPPRARAGLFGFGQMQALVNRIQGELKAVGNTQLVEDVVKVVLHRLLTDEHLLRHLAILVALGDQADNFPFALTQGAALSVACSWVRSQNFARSGELPHYGGSCVRVEPD